MARYDDAVLEEAADTTAKQLADGWFTWENTQRALRAFISTSKEHWPKHHDVDSCVPKQWKRSTQTKELENFGLISSMLSPFCDDLSEFDNQGCKSPTPIEELNCDRYLPAYADAIFQDLDLDGPKYSAVDADIVKQFNELISCLRPHSELLRDLSTFDLRFDRGDAPLICSHSCKKSPAEVRAIKTEIQWMLKRQIALPSHSELVVPCIEVRKPPEKGQLQSPKFVVDYRRLNSVTQRDRYPTPSISSVLDAVSQGKLFAKCNLVSGYRQIPI